MDQAIIKVSSKRQITIPTTIYKKLGIQPGQKLLLEVHGDKLVIWPKTKSFTELLAGSLNGIYGQTKEEIDVYVGKERETWEKTPS